MNRHTIPLEQLRRVWPAEAAQALEACAEKCCQGQAVTFDVQGECYQNAKAMAAASRRQQSQGARRVLSRFRLGPGTALALLIKGATLGRLRTLGDRSGDGRKGCAACRKRETAMNRMGWLTCLLKPWKVAALFTAG